VSQRLSFGNILAESIRVRKDPFHQIKDRYTFKSYDDLNAFYRSTKDYHSKREAFLGR